MLRDSEKTKKLDGYTKDEIIDALVRDFRGGDIDRLIRCLETARIKKITTEQEKADEVGTAALNALLAWRKEMTEKYGNIDSIKSNMTADERAQGIRHEIAWNKAQEKSLKLEAEFRKYIKF